MNLKRLSLRRCLRHRILSNLRKRLDAAAMTRSLAFSRMFSWRLETRCTLSHAIGLFHALKITSMRPDALLDLAGNDLLEKFLEEVLEGIAKPESDGLPRRGAARRSGLAGVCKVLADGPCTVLVGA
jgi:hypothetical protein